jgi:hypothetical protein
LIIASAASAMISVKLGMPIAFLQQVGRSQGKPDQAAQEQGICPHRKKDYNEDRDFYHHL